MPDYTWIYDLLRELDEFAAENKLSGFSEYLSLTRDALAKDAVDMSSHKAKSQYKIAVWDADAQWEMAMEPCQILPFPRPLRHKMSINLGGASGPSA